MTVSLSALHTRAIVLDIEGTTTPVEFVYQVLFPFARAHAAAYLEREWHSDACRAAVALLCEENVTGTRSVRLEADVAPAWARGARDVELASAAAYVYWLMDRDRKSPGLKALQGLVWQDGYRSGELRGRVYPDVAPAFERWRACGCGLYIYSSGSVLAQQLLFGSTNAGDLTKCLRGYFDTAVGPKTAPDSYRAIAERIAVATPEILFVSDVAAELDAAGVAGLRTALCARAGGPDLMRSGPPVPYPIIHTFDDIVD